jgi:hypothetical protein
MNAMGEFRGTERTRQVLLDAHVHLRSCFDGGLFFDSAAANFQAAAGRLGLPPDTTGCLLLAECRGDVGFERIRDEAHRLVNGRWTIHASEDGCTLLGSCEGAVRLAVIAGRQIETRDGLEVLALACTARIQERMGIDETIEAANEHGALAVLPWGVGKWRLRRGAIIRRLIETKNRGVLFIGDNGGRMAWMPRPRLLKRAQDLGFITLPGTDPLPLAGHARRPGLYGCALEIPPGAQELTGNIKQAVRRLQHQPPVFGRLESVLGFCTSQLALRMPRASAATC